MQWMRTLSQDGRHVSWLDLTRKGKEMLFDNINDARDHALSLADYGQSAWVLGHPVTNTISTFIGVAGYNLSDALDCDDAKHINIGLADIYFEEKG